MPKALFVQVSDNHLVRESGESCVREIQRNDDGEIIVRFENFYDIVPETDSKYSEFLCRLSYLNEFLVYNNKTQLFKYMKFTLNGIVSGPSTNNNWYRHNQ